jgi:cobyrinic acid a,c-diamide synthase
LLDTIPASNTTVSIHGHYDTDDTDSKMQAERLAKMVKFPIVLVADACK